MEKLEIFTEAEMVRLAKEISSVPGRIENYKTGDVFCPTEPCATLTTNIQLNPEGCKLQVDGSSTRSRPKADAANAVRLYEFIGHLPRAQAVDKRLWTTLTHTFFWGYTQQRWPIATVTDQSAMRLIPVHSFVAKKGLAGLRRNAVSRLWWSARLTYKPWDWSSEFEVFECDDPARYTKILLSQQQIFSDVMERKFGSSSKVRICYLDSLSRSLDLVSKKDGLVSESSKQLILLLKHKKLDALPITELIQVIDRVIRRSVSLIEH